MLSCFIEGRKLYHNTRLLLKREFGWGLNFGIVGIMFGEKYVSVTHNIHTLLGITSITAESICCRYLPTVRRALFIQLSIDKRLLDSF